MKRLLFIVVLALSAFNVFASSEECESAINRVAIASSNQTTAYLKYRDLSASEIHEARGILNKVDFELKNAIENAKNVCK
jgi:hypothetical protein